MKIIVTRVLLGCVLAGATSFLIISSHRVNSEERRAAVLAGEIRVFEDELPAEAAGEVSQLKIREYEIKVRAYQNLLINRILEAEAKKRGLSLEKLLEDEGKARSQQPTEKDVAAYFEEKKANYEEPLEKIRERVKKDLATERLRDGQRQYIQETWRAAKVEVLLPLPRFSIAPDPQRMRGSASAPVQIVEFSDFQCPFCRRVQPTLNALLEKYGSQVALSFRDFPIIELHPMAHVSAQASRCALAQGKFWEYHNALFADPTPRPDRAKLAAHAAQIGLDAKSFESCLATGTHTKSVDEDLQIGLRAGVSSTPAFFINGIYLSGAQPQAEFERIIDRELKNPRK